MTQAVARGDGVDSVLSATGSGPGCAFPLVTQTDECSGDVFVNGTGVVRFGDRVATHTRSLCITENPTLSTGSSTVFVNGARVGRLGDNYQGDGTNIITSGSLNVFCGG